MRTLIALLLFVGLSFPALATDKESAYDRVMRTGTIKCGYFLYPPVLMKDPNSGKFSGIFYDYIEALAKNLSLKVDWAEEIGLADYPAALESGRIDAYCAGTWIRGSRARVHDYIEPLYYLPLYVYVRKDDHRFDKNPHILNDPQYTLAILEGGATETVRQELFERSKAYMDMYGDRIEAMGAQLGAPVREQYDAVNREYDETVARVRRAGELQAQSAEGTCHCLARATINSDEGRSSLAWYVGSGCCLSSSRMWARQ
jgi:ABC-type amino acid transport substrate-binding protein